MGGANNVKIYYWGGTKLYNYLISTHLINRNNRVCRRLREVLYHNICHEYRACFGKENPDKLFYVIRCQKSDLGFMGLYNHIVHQIQYAVLRGMIPVVDCQYYPNDYLSEDDQVGKINAWEQFFFQPMGVSLQEVYRSRNVIMSAGGSLSSLNDIYDEKIIEGRHRIIEQYVKLNTQVKGICEREAEKLGFSKYRILGVKCRGTDFVASRPKWHSIPPNVQQTIDKIEEMTEKWGGYDFIFVATEDEQIFSGLQKRYGSKLIYNETERISADMVKGKWLNEVFDSHKNEKGYKYNRIMEYLISVWWLAQCDALIGPVVGATLSAMSMKGSYEHLYLFDLGTYD